MRKRFLFLNFSTNGVVLFSTKNFSALTDTNSIIGSIILFVV